MSFLIANPNGTGTDQELLDLTRGMIAQITVYGYAYEPRTGQRVEKERLADLREQVTWLENRIDAASGGANAVNYLSRKRPG